MSEKIAKMHLVSALRFWKFLKITKFQKRRIQTKWVCDVISGKGLNWTARYKYVKLLNSEPFGKIIQARRRTAFALAATYCSGIIYWNFVRNSIIIPPSNCARWRNVARLWLNCASKTRARPKSLRTRARSCFIPRWRAHNTAQLRQNDACFNPFSLGVENFRYFVIM